MLWNSFIRMVKKPDANFVITHPKGYELDSRITGETLIEYNQENAFKNADFVYTKNWCSIINMVKF